MMIAGTRALAPFSICAAVLCAATLCAAGACSQSASSAPAAAPAISWPTGTVLVFDDVPIRADDVDAIASAFAVLEPQDTPVQLRRLALSNSTFPLIAAQGLDPARRATAEQLAHSYREALEKGDLPAGPLTGPMEIERGGYFKDLGFEFWRAAIDLKPGDWSEVIETPGSFHILRVKSRKESSQPGRTRLTIGAFDFPYLDAATVRPDIEGALDRSRLIILDDTWRDAVPAALRYRFHVESP
jgi:hypothetical protein